MRVLYWIELFGPYIGGAEILAAKFLPAMQERGYECTVVTSHSGIDLPDKTLYNDIPVYRFPFHAALVNRNLTEFMAVRQRVVKLKQTFKPDLVHVNSTGADLFFHLHTAAVYPCPTLATIHGLPMMRISGHDSLLGKMLRSANWVAAVSKATLANVRQIVPEVMSRSSVIHNGLGMPAVKPEPLSFDAPRLLCLGRLVAHKGFDLALTAFASLVDCFPQARLVVAGNGRARPDLEQLTAELGLTGAVEFTGWVAPEKVPELINAATVVIMPSRREAFGLVALQAAWMARPIVATRVGGLLEVVVHQQTGLLVEKEDSAALAEGIAFLLEHPEVAIQMGQAARRRVQELFSLERLVDAYDALYRKLVHEVGLIGSI